MARREGLGKGGEKRGGGKGGKFMPRKRQNRFRRRSPPFSHDPSGESMTENQRREETASSSDSIGEFFEHRHRQHLRKQLS